jgi:hypothetical protein
MATDAERYEEYVADYGKIIKEGLNEVSRETRGLAYSIRVLSERRASVRDKVRNRALKHTIDVLKPMLIKRSEERKMLLEVYKRWMRDFGHGYRHGDAPLVRV